MSDTINIGGITVSKFYLGGSSDVKIYLGTTKLYPHLQEPCFAVVDNISTYTARTYVDVYETSSDKWYKLNNLSAYEEYGVYGSGRTITYYEGKLTIDGDYEYQYSGSGWNNVGEVSGSTASLPDVSFVLNYNAKNYDATTHSIPQASGQTKGIDAICNYNPNNIVDHSSDGYISVTGDTRLTVSGGTTSLGRNNTQTGCTMTIVSKALTKNNYSLLTCRGANGVSTLCWMYRQYTDYLLLCGKSNTPTISCSTSNPSVLSVKTYYDGGVNATVKNWTDNTTTGGTYQYYNNYTNGALFCDYLTYSAEYWKGDFYWIYLSHEVLTDEQIQQVIAYNESGGGEIEYPVYYDEIQDPPNNLTFSSMTEAESYECPWVGMHATIDGDNYVFSGDSQSGYEWIYQAQTYVEYVQCGDGTYGGGLQLLTNVTSDFYVEIESEWVSGASSPMLIGEKSTVEVVSYQFGLCYYDSNMFLDYGGGRITTNINESTQRAKHKYGAGHISGSSYQTLVGVTLDNGVRASKNTSVSVEGLPYLVGGGIAYSGHTSSDVKIDNNGTVIKIYSIKIYTDYGETLIGDYIPVAIDNNVVTLYDNISGNYATPYGILSAGPAV